MAVARMMAGVPALNAGLYRTIGFLVGDPVVWIELLDEQSTKHLILRDIEMELFICSYIFAYDNSITY